MRVLLVKTSSLGDVVHTLPALTDAQRAIPGIQFDWVVEEGFAGANILCKPFAQVSGGASRRVCARPVTTWSSMPRDC